MLSRSRRALLVVALAALGVTFTAPWLGCADSRSRAASIASRPDGLLRSGMFAKGQVTQIGEKNDA